MTAKILIVDDSATDRLIIKNMLSGFDVLTACDGAEAMGLVDTDPDIELIILDLNMPVMDGFEVLEALKSDERYRKLRTIILTNFDELDNEIKGLKLGAVDYVRKPVNMDALRVRIDIHIRLLRIQQLLETKLRDSSITFNAIFNQAPIGIAIYNQNLLTGSEIVSVNPMFEEITGKSREKLTDIIYLEDKQRFYDDFNRLKSSQINCISIECRVIKADDSFIWAHVVAAPLDLSDGYENSYLFLVQDISKRKSAEIALAESERSKSVLLSHIPGLAYRCGSDNLRTMHFVSDGCYELTGYTPQMLLNNREIAFVNLIVPEYREHLAYFLGKAAADETPYKQEYEILTAQGNRKWVMELGQGIYDKDGGIESMEGIILDISSTKKIERELKFNNEHDLWTGLFNRRYLESVLKMHSEEKINKNRALVSINLSSIHLLSITYGFQYGQDLTKKAARALQELCDQNIRLYVISEYQFVYYLEYFQQRKSLEDFCNRASELLEKLLETERIGGGIGCLEINEDNMADVDKLLKNLVIASEKAIDIHDRDFGICFFDKKIETEIRREEIISRELAEIAKGEKEKRLYLNYQPILELSSGKISGFEALARLNSLELGAVSPLEFIPIAEKTKVIIPLGQKIIEIAFKFANTLRDRGYFDIGVSVNISAIQLLRKGFAENLLELIRIMGVDPKNIGLEITESVFSSNYIELNRTLGVLRDYGLKIAIDDFGVKYSSLARERELNANCLKIDKYFIDKLMYIGKEEAITKDIISMAHKLGHCTIAEGVEHKKQLEYLKEFGCDRIQGYLIARPMEEEEALLTLEQSFV